MRKIVFIASVVLLIALAGGAAFAGPTVAIPEPTSLALVAGGLGALALVKFRRRK
jgi:hypothetical protein